MKPRDQWAPGGSGTAGSRPVRVGGRRQHRRLGRDPRHAGASRGCCGSLARHLVAGGAGPTRRRIGFPAKRAVHAPRRDRPSAICTRYGPRSCLRRMRARTSTDGLHRPRLKRVELAGVRLEERRVNAPPAPGRATAASAASQLEADRREALAAFDEAHTKDITIAPTPCWRARDWLVSALSSRGRASPAPGAQCRGCPAAGPRRSRWPLRRGVLLRRTSGVVSARPCWSPSAASSPSR
jgi:hypothetical protein